MLHVTVAFADSVREARRIKRDSIQASKLPSRSAFNAETCCYGAKIYIFYPQLHAESLKFPHPNSIRMVCWHE